MIEAPNKVPTSRKQREKWGTRLGSLIPLLGMTMGRRVVETKKGAIARALNCSAELRSACPDEDVWVYVAGRVAHIWFGPNRK